VPLVVAEQCGLRIGEVASLAWADVNEPGCKLRLRRENTKTRNPRTVPVPPWLMDTIAATVAREDRTPGRLVFPGVTNSVAEKAMERACTAAAIAHYHPHDLRHRRLSLWMKRGEDPALVARWAGHNLKELLETYTHVMIGGEVPEATLRALVGAAGDDRVMTDPATVAANPYTEPTAA
jgi:integrase